MHSAPKRSVSRAITIAEPVAALGADKESREAGGCTSRPLRRVAVEYGVVDECRHLRRMTATATEVPGRAPRKIEGEGSLLRGEVEPDRHDRRAVCASLEDITRGDDEAGVRPWAQHYRLRSLKCSSRANIADLRYDRLPARTEELELRTAGKGASNGRHVGDANGQDPGTRGGAVSDSTDIELCASAGTRLCCRNHAESLWCRAPKHRSGF